MPACPDLSCHSSPCLSMKVFSRCLLFPDSSVPHPLPSNPRAVFCSPNTPWPFLSPLPYLTVSLLECSPHHHCLIKFYPFFKNKRSKLIASNSYVAHKCIFCTQVFFSFFVQLRHPLKTSDIMRKQLPRWH